jgi:hypothetical protein
MDRRKILDMVLMSSFALWERRPALDDELPELAVHRLNNSIALSWGLEVGELDDRWAKKYPDQHDSSIHLLDVLYRDNLIYRTQYAAVDCARAYIPLPTSKQTNVVSRLDYKLAELINYIGNVKLAHAYFESHFNTSGFSVRD